MGAYRLGKLRMKNFRSYEDTEISFSPCGLTLIRGFNLDTGGSSFSGKSSIPVAIAMALGFCPFSIKDQQSWGSKGGMLVSLELILDDGTWVITRGVKTSLKPPQGETITGVEAVDAKLKELVGVDPKVLSAQTYRRQKSEGVFLHKTDAEKKDFLCTVTPLAAIEASIAVAEDNIKVVEARMASVKARFSDLNSTCLSLHETELVEVDELALEVLVNDIHARLEDLRIEESSLASGIASDELEYTAVNNRVLTQHADQVIAAKAAVALLSEEMTAFVPGQESSPGMARLKADYDKATSRLATMTEDDAEVASSKNAQKLGLNVSYNGAAVIASQIPRLTRELATKGEERLVLAAMKCPTCEQDWKDSFHRQDKNDRECDVIVVALAEAGLAKKEMAALLEEMAAIVFVPNPKIVRYQEIVSQLAGDIRVEAERLRSALAQQLTTAKLELASIQQLVSGQQAQESADIKARLGNTRRELDSIRVKVHLESHSLSLQTLSLKSTRLENEARRKAHESRMDERKKAEKARELSRLEFVAAEADKNAELDFIEMVGYRGFLGAVFEEILGEITEEANTILGSVANTAHVTIAFNSEAVSLKGVTRKEIRPVVTIGGFEANLASGASGGMGTSIDLAVDLAVANVVSRRTNSCPGWLILDESFEGLDSVSKETCVEMLAKHAGTRLILVVDHAGETGELFPQKLDIEFKNGKSRLREQE